MRLRVLSLPIAAVIAAGCAGTSAPAGNSLGTRQPHAAGHQVAHHHDRAVAWPTYHRTNDRAGHLAAAVAPPLHRLWAANLDGAVYGEPLAVGGLVIAATENDTVYGLHPASGKPAWRRHLGTPQPRSGLPCGDIDPLGITGTPAYDAKTGSVFVVAETAGGHHTLWALNARTGARRWHRNLDVLPSRNRLAEQQRSALLVTHGRVIVTFGGLFGDCDNYVGYATSVATTGHGATYHYAVPTAREAGMWAPAGPVVGRNGNVYVASGNGAELNGRWDKSDSVTELTPTRLHRKAVFAPATWAADNRADLDLGSSTPVPVGHRIVIAGKRGTVYLLRPGLGGIGGDIAQVSGCPSYGGAARAGTTVVLPCSNGVRALRVTAHGLHWKWSAPGVVGSPVIAGHRVYVPDRDSGTLRVLSLRTGHGLASAPVGSLTHFPSAAIHGTHLYVPTLSGVTALHGS
jgi:outer membrane protein assembly factor BamB